MKLNAAANPMLDDRGGAIKRSQTFSPSARHHGYVCKLNRSDSDSAMPLYRRGMDPFRRNAVERRSLRVRRQASDAVRRSKSHGGLHATFG